MHPKRFLLSLLALLVLTACGGSGMSEEEQAVADAAETWFTAVLSQDGATIEQYNCNLVDSTPGSADVISLYAMGLAAKNGNYDPAQFAPDVTFETTTLNESTAQVQVSGQIPVPSQIREYEVYLTLPALDFLQFDEEWDFVKEDNLWRWCGSVGE